MKIENKNTITYSVNSMERFLKIWKTIFEIVFTFQFTLRNLSKTLQYINVNFHYGNTKST